MTHPNPKGIQKSIAASAISLIMIMTLVTESYAEPYPVFMGVNLKQKAQMVDQLEFYQQAVDRLQKIIDTKNAISKNSFTLKQSNQFEIYKKKPTSVIGTLECDACWIAAEVLDSLVGNNIFQGVAETAAVLLCSTELNFSICRGYVNSLADVIIENLQGLLIKPSYLCSEVLTACDIKYYNELDPEVFIKGMLSDKPDNILDDNFVNNLYQEIQNDPHKDERQILKMVQFTDIHLDLKYVSGTNKICNYVICCREVNGHPTDKSQQAGPLGTYGCDVPVDVLTTMGEYINANLQPDIIFWTGDIVPHDQWEYDVEYVTQYQTRLADFMKQNLTKYSIYPLEGNHDFEVANSQSFLEPDTMLDINLQLWKDWLDEEAQEVYAKVGYYTQKLKLKDGTVFDKVNIVAINTQPCYNFNFYLWSQRDDPGGVLQWLNETFHAIEARGEIAIIISHIPPGEQSCLYQWSIRYKAISDRFQHLIRFSIYGHVHEEIHNIAKSVSTGRPVGVQYWAGSLSTWYQVNPSFRMFEVDVETMLPVKIHTYSLNIQDPNPQWKYDHEMTQLYNMTDLSPKSFVEMSTNMLDDEHLALTYANSRSAGGPQSHLDNCDIKCRKDLYCQTTNSVYFEYKDCVGEDRHNIKEDPLNTFLEYMGDPWVVPLN